MYMNIHIVCYLYDFIEGYAHSTMSFQCHVTKHFKSDLLHQI